MQWAVAMEYRPDNPCERVAATLGRQRRVVRHMRALPHAEVAEAVATVRASGATTAAKLAFEFLVLTAARSGEVRLARWDEIDLDAEVWTVPAERMKANREHRVPLSSRAAEILRTAFTVRNGNKLVFPSPCGKPLSDMTLSKLLKEQGVQAVPHGFRSSFRDWAAEETNHPREVVEAALAHRVTDQVEAAYARSTLFERRRRLMADWGAYLAGTPVA
ncbi:MAG: site-specific integrase [Acidobacteria bacterium]|nr:site-specific integrase [Acidobacteriota bacterium]